MTQEEIQAVVDRLDAMAINVRECVLWRTLGAVQYLSHERPQARLTEIFEIIDRNLKPHEAELARRVAARKG